MDDRSPRGWLNLPGQGLTSTLHSPSPVTAAAQLCCRSYSSCIIRFQNNLRLPFLSCMSFLPQAHEHSRGKPVMMNSTQLLTLPPPAAGSLEPEANHRVCTDPPPLSISEASLSDSQRHQTHLEGLVKQEQPGSTPEFLVGSVWAKGCQFACLYFQVMQGCCY